MLAEVLPLEAETTACARRRQDRGADEQGAQERGPQREVREGEDWRVHERSIGRLR